jgi:hypothetical protein
MRRGIRTLAGVSCILVLAGCEVEQVTFGTNEGAARRADWWLETDSLVYTVEYTPNTVVLDIAFTFHNRTSRTLAVPRCAQVHRPALEKLVYGEWHEVYRPFEECWADPLLIPPGAVRRFSYPIRAPRTPAGEGPRFETSHIPGRHRLRWEVYEHDPFAPYRIGWPLPLQYRVSNEFRLVD